MKFYLLLLLSVGVDVVQIAVARDQTFLMRYVLTALEMACKLGVVASLVLAARA